MLQNLSFAAVVIGTLRVKERIRSLFKSSFHYEKGCN